MRLAGRYDDAYIHTMIGDLYTGKLLEAAAAIPAAGRLAVPDASSTKVSRVCGSEITIDLKFDEGHVTKFAMEASACALGQAAASMVAHKIVGADASELVGLRDQMRAMLKEDGPAPSAPRWAELAALQVIKDYPQRHASTLLVFEVIEDCLLQLGIGDVSCA